MKHYYRILLLFLIIFLGCSEWAWAFDLDMGPGGITSTLALATAVQKAVEAKNFTFLAVIILMFGIQILKSFSKNKMPHMKRNAAQYSAMGGAAIGAAGSAAMGSDPVHGATGGFMVGNAASGLYSTLKRPVMWLWDLLTSGLVLKYLLPIAGGLGLTFALYKGLKRSPREKRKKILTDLDKAILKIKDKENPTTRELEKWFSENL